MSIKRATLGGYCGTVYRQFRKPIISRKTDDTQLIESTTRERILSVPLSLSVVRCVGFAVSAADGEDGTLGLFVLHQVFALEFATMTTNLSTLVSMLTPLDVMRDSRVQNITKHVGGIPLTREPCKWLASLGSSVGWTSANKGRRISNHLLPGGSNFRFTRSE